MELEVREVAKRVVEREWQRSRATMPIQIQGESMGATLPAGTFVEVDFSERPRLSRGDIIYFRKGPLRVAHRLLVRLGPLCVEKGDANRRPGWCLYSDILGTARPRVHAPDKAKSMQEANCGGDGHG